jgi:hypothetical protein
MKTGMVQFEWISHKTEPFNYCNKRDFVQFFDLPLNLFTRKKHYCSGFVRASSTFSIKLILNSLVLTSMQNRNHLKNKCAANQ